MLPKALREILPPALVAEVLRALLRHPAVLSEVRVRRGRRASLSLFAGGELSNLPLSYIATEEEVQNLLGRACGGSVYAFEEGIKEGYVSLPEGVRLGVCGRAVVRDGVIHTLSSVDSLVFRLPHKSVKGGAALSRFFLSCEGGILLFSPPGGGKTTALRGFVDRVSEEKRVAVVDTRGELCGFSENALVDVLSGYPKAKGAEIAVRTLSPEVLVLDEIGAAEADALLSLSSLGVRVVASVHAESAAALLATEKLRALFACRLFSSLWDVREDKAVVPDPSFFRPRAPERMLS